MKIQGSGCMNIHGLGLGPNLVLWIRCIYKPPVLDFQPLLAEVVELDLPGKVGPHHLQDLFLDRKLVGVSVLLALDLLVRVVKRNGT